MTSFIPGSAALSLHGSPSNWLKRFGPLLQAQSGTILDLACGAGRNSLYLKSLNLPVLGVDREAQGFHALNIAGVKTMQFDLAAGELGYDWPFGENAFAAIVVCNYLHRPLFPHLIASLQDNGLLIYETFAAGNENFGKPANPAFLLQTGELLLQMQSNRQIQMSVLAYEEGYIDFPKPAVVQRICARKAGKISMLDKL